MANNYGNWYITTMFTEAEAAAANSANKITFTRMIASQDTFTQAELPTLTNSVLGTINIKQQVPVSAVMPSGNTFKVQSVFMNDNVPADYMMNTFLLVGSYNGNEFLAAAQVANTAFKMPADTNSEQTIYTNSAQIVVSNTASVSVTVDPNSLVTNAGLQATVDTINATDESQTNDINTLKTADTNNVKTTGNQLIDGIKTFSQKITASISGTADTALKFLTPRKLKVNLASTADQTFDGSADQVGIGVSGVLPINYGGTGRTDGVNVRGSQVLGITDFNAIQLPTSTSPSVRGFPFSAYGASNTPNASETGFRGWLTAYDQNGTNTIELIAVGTSGTLYVGKGTTTTTNQLVTTTSITWRKLSDDSTVVHNTGDETISGNKTFNTGVYTNGGLFSKGVEVTNTTPYVDFHYANDTGDYTSRIIENTKGQLTFLTTAGAKMKISADLQGTADVATKLTTARSIQTNLELNSTSNFDGTANITPGVTGVLPIKNGGTGRTDGGAVALDSLSGVTSVLSFTLPTGLDGTMRTWQVTISNDTGTPDTQVYTGFLIGGSGSNIFRWILLHNITRQLYTATGNYTRTGDTYTVSSLDWAVTSDTKRPLPIVTADSSSTGAAYTVTNSTLPLSIISSKGYTFKFIPNVTSTSTGATLSINGMAPTKFGKVDSYTGSIIAVSDTNSDPAFLKTNTYTLTYSNGFFVIVDMTQPNAASLVGTVSTTNGGTGRTDGLANPIVAGLSAGTDLNTLTTSGYYKVDTSDLNIPAGMPNGAILFVANFDAAVSYQQIMARQVTASTTKVTVWYRLRYTSWGAWQSLSKDDDVIHNTGAETVAGVKTFSSPIIGSLTGNSDTATKLATARTIAVTGDVTGSGTFDGSGNLSITTTEATTTRTDTTSTQAGGYGSTVTIIDGVTTNSAGEVTGVNTKTLTLPSAQTTVTGNAGTATKLATARTIGGVSFDGTANINLPGVNTAGNQSTSGNAGTATKLASPVLVGGVSFDGSTSINLPGVNIAGNQSTTGNAGSATKLQTARTINGVAFDGTANISVNAANDASLVHNTGNETIAGVKTFTTPVKGTIFNRDLTSDTDTKTLVESLLSEFGNNTPFNISYTTYASKLTDSPIETQYLLIEIYSRAASRVYIKVTDVYNKSAFTSYSNGTVNPWESITTNSHAVHNTGDETIAGVKTFTSPITGSVTGNSGTATKLQTARTISLNGDLAGSGTFDGSGDISITAKGTSTTINLYGKGTYFVNDTATDGDYLRLIVSGKVVSVQGTLRTSVAMSGGVYLGEAMVPAQYAPPVARKNTVGFNAGSAGSKVYADVAWSIDGMLSLDNIVNGSNMTAWGTIPAGSQLSFADTWVLA